MFVSCTVTNSSGIRVAPARTCFVLHTYICVPRVFLFSSMPVSRLHVLSCACLCVLVGASPLCTCVVHFRTTQLSCLCDAPHTHDPTFPIGVSMSCACGAPHFSVPMHPCLCSFAHLLKDTIHVLVWLCPLPNTSNIISSGFRHSLNSQFPQPTTFHLHTI